jgi:hypothetical protein
MTSGGPRSALRMLLAVVVAYGVMRGVVIASNVLLLLALGMPPEGRVTTPYLAANVAASFIAAIVAGYACARLAPHGRMLVSLGLLVLLFLAGTVAVYRATPDSQQPMGFLPLVALLSVVGLVTGAMIERARHGNKT